jgi:hypothetical protein
MSKQFPGLVPPAVDSVEQLRFLANYYRNAVYPATLARFVSRTRELGLEFSDEELLILAALDTPQRVQDFLNTQIYYNNDHASAELEETAMPPRRVLQTARAHCFEGAMFAYAVDYLHGFDPRMVMLEASQDAEHNLVVIYDAEGNWYSANAHSRYAHLDGRRPQYTTIRQLAESYAPWYYSDRTRNPKDVTLVGYSEPFDLVAKYGVKWMDTLEPLWDIYYTYIDDTIHFHYINDDSPRTHLYPVVNALKQKWIQLDAQGCPFVSVGNLPLAAQELWREFWRVHDPNELPTRGAARELEKQFWDLTGTTPIDLQDNADDLQYFLAAGYRIEQLVTGASARTSDR